MANDLIVSVERELNALSPKFAQVLGRLMPPERIVRTVVTAVETNPKLLEAERSSLYSAAMTFAVLGLEVDGVTGQGFLIPFKNRVQPVIGYLGYNTLGARAGMTITGRVVREGDDFDFDEATGTIMHKRKLGDEGSRRIVGAWARASAVNRPAVARVLSIDQLLAVKAKSPGARRAESPWNDNGLGYEAMCEKTAKRRLRRDMPLNVYQLAGIMEEQHEELGRHAWIHPERGVMTDAGDVIAPSVNDVTPTASELLAPPDLAAEARMAAERGTEPFRAFWRRQTDGKRAELKARLDMAELERVAKAADGRENVDNVD